MVPDTTETETTDGYVFENGKNGFRENGPYRDATSPRDVVGRFETENGRNVVPGDRVVVGSHVYELNHFGQAKAVASGPAGEGIIATLRNEGAEENA